MDEDGNPKIDQDFFDAFRVSEPPLGDAASGGKPRQKKPKKAKSPKGSSSAQAWDPSSWQDPGAWQDASPAKRPKEHSMPSAEGGASERDPYPQGPADYGGAVDSYGGLSGTQEVWQEGALGPTPTPAKEKKKKKHKSQQQSQLGTMDLPAFGAEGSAGFDASASGFGTSDFSADASMPADYFYSGGGGGGYGGEEYDAAYDYPPYSADYSESTPSYPSAPQGQTSETMPRASSRSSKHSSKHSVRWAPSRRELRKYASLFLRLDGNRDGFVEYEDAYSLCERSGLQPDVITRAMQIADLDQDGKYTFHEWVGLTHLLSGCLRGGKMPKPERGLPKELSKSIAELSETPEDLHEERSTSGSSRSGSTSRASTSPAFPSSPASSSVSIPEGAYGREAASRSGAPYGGQWAEDYGVGVAGVLDESEELPLDIPSIVRHLKAVLQSDRVLLQQLTQENDHIEDTLAGSRDQLQKLHIQVQRERHDVESVQKSERSLEQHLMASKQQLEMLQREGWNRMLQGVMLEQHREQFSEELDFMRHLAEQERRMLEDVQRTNEFLERSFKKQHQYIQQLERQRHDLERQANVEKEGLEVDHREIAALQQQAGVHGPVTQEHSHGEQHGLGHPSPPPPPIGFEASSHPSPTGGWNSTSLVSGHLPVNSAGFNPMADSRHGPRIRQGA